MQIKIWKGAYYSFFYHARSSKRNKQGRTAYDARARMEEDAKLTTTHDAFIRELAKIIDHTRTAKNRPGGVVSYSTRYRQSSTGYKGRLFAEGVALSKAPRAIRAIAYSDLDVRDWDVSMAYFTFASQAVDKLMIDQDNPHFRLETVKAYIRSKETVYESMKNTREITTPCCKTMCHKVFNGGSICPGYESNKYLQGFTSSKDQRILRTIFSCWSFAFHVSGGKSYQVASNHVGSRGVRSTCRGGKEKVGGGKRAVIFPGQD